MTLYDTLYDICLTCRHSRIDHSDFVGPCEYIKWIAGHP
jgi:hypothetical protein